MRKVVAYVGVWASLIACLLTIVMPDVALAATASPAPSTPGAGQALEIAPPLISLTANPGDTVQAQIKLRDVAKTDLLVTNQINDFVAGGENGTPKILTGDVSNNPFTLQSWINPLPSFQLSPQTIQTLTVKINVPANASPGGHYGVIRFTGTAPQINGTGVALSASLGALVLLTVNGNLTHKLSVQEFSVNNGGSSKSVFESPPLTFVVRLKNTGNVQEEPVGNIMITDMFGKTIAGMNVNVPPHNILPNSVRKFTTSLDKTVIGNKHLFGHYKAELSLSYGGGKQTMISGKLSFWIIPYKLILLIIIVLIGGFFGLRYGLRRYNQRIIAKAKADRKKK